MKKLLSLSLLCIGMLGGARAQTCGTTISSYPYFENFDGAGATGWVSGGTSSTWALGTPAKSVINSAASGTRAWVTGLTGLYNASEQSYVESPCFNMSTLAQPIVEMKIWWQSEFSWDGAVLQSSIDNGATWQNVGVKGDPNNWYNDNSINGMPGGQPATIAEGWSGRNSTNNGSGGWVTARHVLTGLGGKPNVKLRIAFGADPAVHDEGFAFDNFAIYDTPANDAGLTAITAPTSPVVPLASQPVMVTVKNFGTANLTAATLGFSVNGVLQPTFAWTGNVALNATSAPVQIGTFAFPAGVHNIKAWSKLPNGATDGYPGNDTTSITINSCNSLSGSYTINKNTGASASNFTSFASVAQVLASCGVSGPVTFSVASGSGPYNEVINLTAIPGTSATNTITFNGNGNTVMGIPASATDGVIKLDGAKFFRFNNFTIENLKTATSASAVFLVNNASNNTFSGCTINNSITSTAVLYGINMGAECDNNAFLNNLINGGYYGAYFNGTYTKSINNNQFTGNTLRDQNSYGFYTSYSTNTLIENNDISRPLRTNVSSLYGVYLTTGATSTIISKNRIHNTHDAALVTTSSVYGVYIVTSATPGNENIVKNNAVYNVNNTNGYYYGFFNGGSNGVYYYHNTVVSDPAITYNTLRGMHFSTSATNVKFINNIISIPSTATSKHALYLGNITIALVSNNNDLYIGTTGNTGYFSADRATLADWKAVNTNAYDQNSQAADPNFVNATYLQPLAGILNNAGQALPAITDDLNGAVRSTTTPDPGAYEFTPAANDAGVTAISGPTSPVTPGSQAVQVTLKNFGTATLASATIGWSVNGVDQANYAWTGNLTNLQTSAPVNIGNYNFPAGTFTLKVWAKLPNGTTDALAVNDTTILRLNSCAPLSGSYTINKNNPTGGTNFQSISAAAQKLNTCGVSGPVTFTVAAGTGPYNEQVEILNIPNTSATDIVTFEGSGNTVSAMPLFRPGVFVLNGAKYVKVNNFVITLDATATMGYGVQFLNSADNNTVSNNTINLPIAASHPGSATGLVSGIVAGVDVVTAGNNTSNSSILNNIINGGYYGIVINGNTSGLNAVNNQIVGNQVKDAHTYGIAVSNANGTLVEGNDISRATRTNGGAFYNVYMTGANLNTIVSKNRMHNANDNSVVKTGTLWGVYTSSPATPGNENIIRNNAIYNLNNTNGYFYAFQNSGGNGTYYYNNTVATDSAVTYNTIRGMYFTAASTNVKFINNILSLPGNASFKYAIYLQSSAISLVSNNNDLDIGTYGNIGFYANLNQVSLADWKAINAGAFDQNSVSMDPIFANAAAGNLKPTAVLADNLGQPLTAVTDDILGATRNVVPDFGAFEFGIAATDVAITAVSGPSLSGCGLSATESITVTIRNFGANAQLSVPVNLWVNGVLQTVTPETYNASPIAPNASVNYTFIAKANLATSGPYVIAAKTQLPGDLNTANDSDTLRVINSLIGGLPVTFDFETATTGISRFQTIVKPNSTVTEGTGASFGAGIKGMLMDGVDNINWVTPVGVTDPWTNNADNFSAVYFCVSPGSGAATDSLVLTFDLKQLYKAANVNTNFRVTVNGTQVGPTYRPPFSGTPINWQKVKIDLTAFMSSPTIQVGLESSVKEAYANGTGTANLIDNIEIKRVAVVVFGVKEKALLHNVAVYPNPSAGLFNLTLPEGKTCELTVTDLTGKVLKKQTANGPSQLNLTGTAKGIYLLRISSENGSAVRKLIVE